MATCPKCKGRKILEYEAGLIQMRCPECKGKGEIDVIDGDIEDNRGAGVEPASKPRKRKKRTHRKAAATVAE